MQFTVISLYVCVDVHIHVFEHFYVCIIHNIRTIFMLLLLLCRFQVEILFTAWGCTFYPVYNIIKIK